MKDFRKVLAEMNEDDEELMEQIRVSAGKVNSIFRAHNDDVKALLGAVTRCYIEFCDKHDIDREQGMMMLHAEQLLYLANVDIDSIPPLDEED